MLTYGHRDLLEKLELTHRQLTYFCDKGVVKPYEDGNGRGTARKYSDENVAEVRLGMLLREMEFEMQRVAEIVEMFRLLRNDYDPSSFAYMVVDGHTAWFSNDLPEAVDGGFMMAIDLEQIPPGLPPGVA